MSITGEAEGAPTKTGVAIVDVVTGLYATVGIVAALAERKTSGVGQFIEVNLLSSALAALINQSSAFVSGGVVPGRMGNLHPSITPYETFPTATDPIAIAATNERQFSGLCKSLDALHLLADERWSTNTARVEHREALTAELTSILRLESCEHWVSRLTEHGIPCSPVNSIDAAFALAADLASTPCATCPVPAAIPGQRSPTPSRSQEPRRRIACIPLSWVLTPPRCSKDSDPNGSSPPRARRCWRAAANGSTVSGELGTDTAEEPP